MKTGYVVAAVIFGAFCALGSPAQAAVVDSPALDFVVSGQSLWGGGPTGSLQFSDSASLMGINFGYDFGASTGTVSADINGRLRADYSPDLAAPGSTSVTLNFLGDASGGQWSSDFGIWAKINAGSTSLLDFGYSLNLDSTFTPALGGSSTATDTLPVEVPAVGYAGLVEVGAGFQVEQTSTLSELGLAGILNYQLRGTASTYQTPFLVGGAGVSAPLDLNQAGTWDIWVTGLDLQNSFASDFDLGLFLYATYPDVQWCSKWGIPYPCGIGMETEYLDLGEFNLFAVSPFALDFNTISFSDPMFSINVAAGNEAPIPEPGTLLLLGSGLAGLAGYGRRRMKSGAR